MKFDHILIHYGEIALKGKNRAFFEVQLMANIKSQLEAFAPGSFEDVKKAYGSIIVKLTEKGIAEEEQVTNALKHTFGIVNFSFAASLSHDIEGIKQACWEMLRGGDFESFRITSTRSDKQFPFTSEQLNREVGEFVFENFQREKKVDLKNPQRQCFIHILHKIALVSSQKLKGPGGLPVGTGGKAMVLMSGGFDSPIAAWQVLKRGVSLRYAHFHSIPYTSRESLEKVQDLVKVLRTYGASGKIYSIPFADVQKQIMMNCPQSLRVILYRRFMMRISETLARKEKCLALVTGDSIGQVASQTLENIFAVSQAASMPIFRPLIGEDKEDIMQKAREIGTYDISKLPHDDCCTRLMPKNPETRARLTDVLEAEKNLNIEKLVQETLAKTERIDVE